MTKAELKRLEKIAKLGFNWFMQEWDGVYNFTVMKRNFEDTEIVFVSRDTFLESLKDGLEQFESWHLKNFIAKVIFK